MILSQGAIFLNVTPVSINGSISFYYDSILTLNYIVAFVSSTSNEFYILQIILPIMLLLLYPLLYNELYILYFTNYYFMLTFWRCIYLYVYKIRVYCQMLKVACYIPKDLLSVFQEVAIVPLFSEIFHYMRLLFPAYRKLCGECDFCGGCHDYWMCFKMNKGV